MKKIILAVGAVGIIVLLFAAGRSDNKTSNIEGNKNEGLTQVTNLRDVHGLSVDAADSSKVWFASHTGLHLLKDDKDLYVVGNARDDYMGFSPHPTDPNTFFTSGHPSSGGNIGFQKSTDAGKTWQKVSSGANGPVDFHAMAVSRVDPNVVYGYFRGKLQRSVNEGKDWQILDTSLQNAQIISLTTDPSEKDTVYAATTKGLMISRDQGQTWRELSENLKDDVITNLAANPKNSKELLAYGQKLGLAKSTDGGQTWVKIESSLASSPVMYMSYDKNNPSTIYAINQSLDIYKTTDGGVSWNKVR